MFSAIFINNNSTLQVTVPSEQTQIPAARVLLSTPTSSDQLTVPVIDDDILYQWLILGQDISTPFTLQFIDQREEGEDFLITLSDGKSSYDFLLSTRYDYIFKKKLIKINCMVKVLEFKKTSNKVLLTNIQIVSKAKLNKIGDPIEL